MKAAFSLLSLALLAAAAPAPQSISQCNTGNISCCNSLQNSTDQSVSELAGLLGITLPNIGLQVGLGCSPITLAGLGLGAGCEQQPVCCTGNSFQGLINLGCSPLAL
ncbi:hypothetical protein Clacol_007874 [Clathrus columnatus]|uniref:Hydrophobin n=1 Tax=Clathrus columnatus TaxID=1419009 RepID=A0AAV5ALQ6_9AGAM|nr:hypothetical protein Clacol_007874 [Clathrus columnatus]